MKGIVPPRHWKQWASCCYQKQSIQRWSQASANPSPAHQQEASRKGIYFFYLWREVHYYLLCFQCDRKACYEGAYQVNIFCIPSYLVYFSGCGISGGKEPFPGCSRRSVFIGPIESLHSSAAVTTWQVGFQTPASLISWNASAHKSSKCHSLFANEGKVCCNLWTGICLMRTASHAGQHPGFAN